MPPHAAGVVGVTVTTSGGTATRLGRLHLRSGPDGFQHRDRGLHSAIRPDRRGAGRSPSTGTNLENATAVDFGADGPGAIVLGSNTATTISAISPAGAVGTVDVTVVTPGGTSATSPADVSTYVPPPIITSIVATAGPQSGGNIVTIYGQNLEDGDRTCNFGGNVASRIGDSPRHVQRDSGRRPGVGDLRHGRRAGLGVGRSFPPFPSRPTSTPTYLRRSIWLRHSQLRPAFRQGRHRDHGLSLRRSDGGRFRTPGGHDHLAL